MPRRRGGRRGVSAIEFALLLPVLLVLTLATIDFVWLLRDALRIERVASEVCNIVTQYQRLRVGNGQNDLDDIFGVAARIGDPLAVTGSGGVVIVTGLANSGSGTTVLWQQSRGLSGYASTFGTVGGRASFRAGIPDPGLAAGQGAVVVEVFLRRQPWVLPLARDWLPRTFVEIWSFSLQRPRLVGILQVTT
ncbi:pilus assembly protein [Roseomonas sp. NAR14]|uniref:Pilus assembly protein n=1 Tax=Roseomonas acroporae TaxID=2937791 RepID=A0A9X2BUK5_9PROT|nr:pilus assembly protein [Roseomonas acroporae]